MIGREKLFKKLEDVLAKSKADQTEIVCVGTQSSLTRFANSMIHQNAYENNNTLSFRVAVGKKVGVTSTNSLIKADMLRALDDAYEIALQQPDNPDFAGLPKPAKYRELKTYDEKTANFSPAQRAKAVKTIIKKAKAKKFTVAGAFSTASSEIAVINSKGVRAYQPASSAATNMVVMSDSSSGYASDTTRYVDQIDFEHLADIAVTKCDLSQNPIQLEPGEYEVILEPAAISEVLEWLNYVSFGSKGFEQNMSLLSGKIGKKITSDQISIYDDALDQNAMAFPFDFEGVPKKKVAFIDKGIAKGVVYDTTSAKRAGVKSTGHAIMPEYASEGASSFNIMMKPGKVKREKLIENVKRGILVTRFHYINGLIDPRNSMLTGMTRDGTFLIENGELKSGLKNMRFTDSIMRAFGTVKGISKERERKESWWSAVGCMTVPAVHLKSFKFSGKTEF